MGGSVSRPGGTGSQLTWGDRVFGGEQQPGQKKQLVCVQQIQSTQSAFAAILADRSHAA